MSIERYFARAHDEARRLLREMPWRPLAARAVPPGKRWRVILDNGWSHTVSREASDDAVDEVRVAYSASVTAPGVVCVLREPPAWLHRALDRAMADADGTPTLGPGEGVEARRLLELVAWDRVPQARWPEVFDTLRMAAAWRSAGHENWLTTTRALLEEDGWLVDGAGRKAA